MLNIGEQDQDGRQKRIEHRGKHLRLSRTGGVSLRQQMRIGKFNITSNTSRGVRVSRQVRRGQLQTALSESCCTNCGNVCAFVFNGVWHMKLLLKMCTKTVY